MTARASRSGKSVTEAKSKPFTGILKVESGEIAKLAKMGITESAILRYIVRVHEDKSREKALKALLVGHL